MRIASSTKRNNTDKRLSRSYAGVSVNKVSSYVYALFLLFCLAVSLSAYSQAPQKMSYQSVLRNTTGQLLTNTTVGMQISILQGSATGTVVYRETQTLVTNAFGLVSLQVGAGTVVSGSMASIDWGAGPYYIKTESDPTGGTSYSITGTNQLLSVPYAFYAQNGGSFAPNVNGTGVVSAYDCSSGASTGILSTGIAASGVTKTITATVTSVGTYTIYAISNGVAFTGSGVFTSTGNQDIVLTAIGTPVTVGTSTFTMNTNPGCSFTFDVKDGSSNGTAHFENLNCSAGSTGTMITRQAVSGVTQTISVDVTTAGTYNISTTANGVTFSGNGTLSAGTGQNIVLTANGTPTADGTYPYTLNTNPSCSFSLSSNATPLVSGFSCSSATVTGFLTNGTPTSGVFVSLPYTGGNGIAYPMQLINSTNVTGLVASLYPGTLSNGNGGNLTFFIVGTPAGNGTATFALSLGGQSCSFNVNVNVNAPIVNAAIVPPGMVLGTNQYTLITSVYDNNYLPYTAPTDAASIATVSPGNTLNKLVDMQGSLTTITVGIPVTTAANGNLAAYSTTVNVPASLTEDGNSRNVTFSWESQQVTINTKYITATIAAVGGTLNAKKLDINAGIGKDYLGVLMSSMAYPYNYAGATATYTLFDIPGIPDKKFGQFDAGNTTTYEHQFLYMPVQGEDGNIWLNNNLGADYANINSAYFSPAQQAKTSTDYHAYGSLFQWGRAPDGHELINWTSSSAGTPQYNTTTTQSTTDTPANGLFIAPSPAPYDWRSTPNNNLWATEASPNNPCPSGFRVPTITEFSTWVSKAGVTNPATAASSNLCFSLAGLRGYNYDGTSYSTSYGGSYGDYWSSTVYSTDAYEFYLAPGTKISAVYTTYSNHRSYGFSVRCLKN